MFNNAMVDLETLGTESNSVILSIGVIPFNKQTGEMGPEFYKRVSIQPQLDRGAKINGNTIAFWLAQSDEARQCITQGDVVDPSMMIAQLRTFLHEHCVDIKDLELWGNSARFDLGLLSDLCRMNQMDIFWNFRKERCYRTKLAEKPEVADEIKPIGIVHHPVTDCKTQIYRLFRVLELCKNYLPF